MQAIFKSLTLFKKLDYFFLRFYLGEAKEILSQYSFANHIAPHSDRNQQQMFLFQSTKLILIKVIFLNSADSAI